MTAAVHVLEYNARVYRRIWRGTLFGTILSPILFLASMGLGLGAFVDQGAGAAALGGVSYAMFLAPGLLAAQGMQTAGFEATYPVMGRIVWDKTYHGMLATPITVAGIVFGQLGWFVVRLFIVTGIFFLVMVGFGLVSSPLGVLAVPAAVLTGLSFAAPIMAFTATQRNDTGFNAIFRFLIIPLFIFSGTFFPIDRLPPAMQVIARLTPTWHGVTLARGFTLGTIDAAAVVIHGAVLVGFIAIGTAAALLTFRRALVK